ncbi:MAG: nucleotide kinase domain-containing protein [Litorimonas sp.]
MYSTDLHSKAGSGREPSVNAGSVEVKIAGKLLKTTPVFDAYWRFAAARQNVFLAKHFPQNEPQGCTVDPVIKAYRFTNAYRASDRVSQYLISRVAKASYSERSLFIRVLLFKIFNRIDTWEAIQADTGDITETNFDIKTIDAVLSKRQEDGKRNYSAAYIMPSAGRRFDCSKKHTSHLSLISWMLGEEFPERLAACASMADAYDLMISAPSIGPFLAYQYVTDLNYSRITRFSEMEFVKAGPGALDGISKCFHLTENLTPEDCITYMAESQAKHFNRLEIDFPSLWGRPLQLIDCQNLFCEISKYSRVAFPHIQGVAGRKRIKQNYSPSQKPVESLSYPDEWNIDPTSAPENFPPSRGLETSECGVAEHFGERQPMLL